jgi:hypothetical protein
VIGTGIIGLLVGVVLGVFHWHDSRG